MLACALRRGVAHAARGRVCPRLPRLSAAPFATGAGAPMDNPLKNGLEDVELPQRLKSEPRPPRAYAQRFKNKFPALDFPDPRHPMASEVLELRKEVRREKEEVDELTAEMMAVGREEADEVDSDGDGDTKQAAPRLEFGFKIKSRVGDVQHMDFEGRTSFQKVFKEGAPGALGKEQETRGFMGLLHREYTQRIVEHLDGLNKSFFSSEHSITGAAGAGHTTILGGDAGNGKSVALAQTVLWARNNGWLTVHIPSAYDWVSDGIIYPSRCMPGLWDQPEVAMRFCKNMLAIHGDMLAEIPIRTSFELPGFDQEEDSTLADLLEFAQDSFRYSCDSVYNFRNELSRVTEFPVLLAIDGVNAFDWKSGFGDPNAERHTGVMMPSRSLSLTEIFYDYRSPGFARGTSVCSLSNTMDVAPFHKEHAGRENVLDIEPFKMNEISKFLKYCRGQHWVDAEFTDKVVPYIFALTAGIPREVVRYMDSM